MQTNSPEPQYLLCSLLTVTARKLMAYYDRVLDPFGLTAHQAMALGVLWHEDDISLGVFARRAQIGKAAAVTMIKRLEGMGLVETETDPQDARLNLIRLTGKAREIVPVLLAKATEMEEKLKATLGTSHMERLVADLKAIRSIEW